MLLQGDHRISTQLISAHRTNYRNASWLSLTLRIRQASKAASEVRRRAAKSGAAGKHIPQHFANRRNLMHNFVTVGLPDSPSALRNEVGKVVKGFVKLFEGVLFQSPRAAAQLRHPGVCSNSTNEFIERNLPDSLPSTKCSHATPFAGFESNRYIVTSVQIRRPPCLRSQSITLTRTIEVLLGYLPHQ